MKGDTCAGAVRFDPQPPVRYPKGVERGQLRVVLETPANIAGGEHTEWCAFIKRPSLSSWIISRDYDSRHLRDAFEIYTTHNQKTNASGCAHLSSGSTLHRKLMQDAQRSTRYLTLPIKKADSGKL